MTELSEKLENQMKKHKTYDRPRFLHGVYKQIAVSHKGKRTKGEYREALIDLHSYCDEKLNFMLVLADNLKEYGLNNHANRLLDQQDLGITYDRWKFTLNELEKVDSNWNEYCILRPDFRGVQLSIGEYSESDHFSASIVINGISYGASSNLYEIKPIFNGKNLEEMDYCDEVIGFLSLEDALDIGKAVLSKDELRYEAVLDKVA